jgi:hypothetical protein
MDENLKFDQNITNLNKTDTINNYGYSNFIKDFIAGGLGGIAMVTSQFPTE